jgi:hypothetical protein
MHRYLVAELPLNRKTAIRLLHLATGPGILLALVLLLMMPFLRPPTGIEVLNSPDLVNQQYPLFSFIFDSVRDGHGLPLWNPYQFSGQSIAANPQSSIYYPLAWIMVPLGVPTGVGWLTILHLWWGGWGMAVFMRCLGATRAGSLMAGIVYTFSAYTIVHVNASTLSFLMGWAWPPWIAAAYLWTVERKTWQSALPGALGLGLSILAGYPPMVYFTGIWLIALVIYLRIAQSVGWVVLARQLLIIGVLGLCVGSALLLPVAEFTLRSTRTAGDMGFSNSYALPAAQLSTILFPNLFGEPNNGYWGVPFYVELTLYLGVLPLMAIITARRQASHYLFITFVVLGLIVSLGINGGLFSIFYHLLPGYRLFRVPSRALYFALVGGAGLAGLFVSELQRELTEERSAYLRTFTDRIFSALLLACGILALIIITLFNLVSSGPDNPWRLYHSADVILFTALMLGLCWVLLRAWIGHYVSVNILLMVTFTFVIVDLWRISAPLITVAAVDVPEPWKSLSELVPGDRDDRIMTVPENIVWQSGSIYTRHQNPTGYDPLVSHDNQRLWEAANDNPTGSVARLLGVRYVVSPQPYEWSGLTGIERLRLLASPPASEWYTYQHDDVLLRAFISSVATVMTDSVALQRLSDASHDIRLPIVEGLPICVNESTEAAPIEPVQSITRTPNQVVIEAVTPGETLLVLTESYDPNWVVTVNDQPAELLRTYTALRGVCLVTGENRVVMTYQPRIITVGVIISLGSALLIGMSALVMGVRRRRKGVH